ncbi:MAG: thioredoxin family protein [Victivallaceae bacterium]|nr:thioredoxin family protein [Victivallaceae bacterium]
MKLFAKLSLFACFTLMTGVLTCGRLLGNDSELWHSGPDDVWLVRYDEAIALAKKQNKKIMVLNTGSDWCSFCMRLQEEVLKKPKFRAFAEKNLILLYLDSPRKTQLPVEQVAHNRSVRNDLNLSGGVPLTVVLDSDGREMGRIMGFAPESPYLARLAEIVRRRVPEAAAPVPGTAGSKASLEGVNFFLLDVRPQGIPLNYLHADAGIRQILVLRLGDAVCVRLAYRIAEGRKIKVQVFPKVPRKRFFCRQPVFLSGSGIWEGFFGFQEEVQCDKISVRIFDENGAPSQEALAIPVQLAWRANVSMSPQGGGVGNRARTGDVPSATGGGIPPRKETNASAPPVRQNSVQPPPPPVRQYQPEPPVRQVSLPPRGRSWQRGPDSSWLLHYDEALAKARKEKKLLMILSTGSDWCGFCIRLRQDVLNSGKFRSLASKKLVLLYLDLPKRKPLPEDQRKHNQLVRQKFNFSGGVPSAMIVGPDEKVLGQLGGYCPAKEYMSRLMKIVNKAR